MPLLFRIDRWEGLDRRPTSVTEDRPQLNIADNVQIDLGGQIRLRPALVKIADLSASSTGLYSRGNRLRVVVPGGFNHAITAPPGVTYDSIGKAGASFVGPYARLHVAETYGASGIVGPFGYVCVQRGNVNEHHWIRELVPNDAIATTTIVESLPFSPGAGLVKLASKLWATDPSTGQVRYSSSVNGANDWLSVDDAGSLAVLQHVAGSRDVVTLSHYRGRLAVFFGDAVQLWAVDPDPRRIFLEQVLNGPGVESPRVVANVQGDVFFLGRGGFRTLSTATVTGEAHDTDIGAPIEDLTRGVDTVATNAVAIWSQARSQYLCAVGSTVFVLTYSPLAKMKAWTRWILPVAVDYMCENNGQVFIRSGNVYYQLDDTSAIDVGGVGVTGTIQSDLWSFGAPGIRKHLEWLTVRQTTSASWNMIVDNVSLPVRQIPGGNIPQRVPLGGMGRQIAIRATVTGLPWRLEGLAIEFQRSVL